MKNTLRNEVLKAEEPEAKPEVFVEPEEQEVKTSRFSRAVASFFRFMSGNKIANEDIERYAPMTILVFLLLLVYIGNSYVADNKMKKITRLEKSIKAKKNEYVNLSSTTIDRTRASQIEPRALKLGLKPSMVPVRKIEIDNQQTKTNGRRKQK